MLAVLPSTSWLAGAVASDLDGVADLLVAIKDAARGNPVIQELVAEALYRIECVGPAFPQQADAEEGSRN